MSYKFIYEQTGISQAGGKDKGGKQLCNFVAEVKTENVTIDGEETEIVYVVDGSCDGRELDALDVPAEKLNSMKWISQWGFGPVIYPEDRAADLVSLAIRQNSRNVKRCVQFGSLGWQVTPEGKNIFVMGDTAVGEEGQIHAITNVPPDLCRYEFPGKYVGSTVDTLGHAAGYCGAILSLYAMRSVLGDVDFGVHVAGRSGSFKSELAACMMHYFGAFNGRNLPAGWSSTANALEALCHKAKDVCIVIDDYVPQGSSFHVKALQGTADRIFRGLGNRMGRARMSDTAAMRQTYYPRGGVVSTGEDVPEGHSMRGRMLVLECSKGSLSPERLTELQAERDARRANLQNFVKCLAAELPVWQENYRDLARDYRSEFAGIGHSRTPDMLASLLAAAEIYANATGADLCGIPQEAFVEILKDCGTDQAQYLVANDIASVSKTMIEQGLLGSKCHFVWKEGGRPVDAAKFGWKTDGKGELRPAGQMIGWVSVEAGKAYLSPDLAYQFVKRASGGEVAVTRTTWVKRLVESGLVCERDEKNQRNTVRITCDGVSRSVIAIALESIGLGESDEEESDLDPFGDVLDELTDTDTPF